jgi:hypothetical protein
MGRRTGKCSICGNLRELSADHLPQKSLYPKEIRRTLKNMHVVMACSECNNSSSEIDELFKVIFGQVGDAPWRSEMLNSVDATLASNKRLDRLLTENTRVGIVEGREIRTFKLPRVMNEILIAPAERIVKGLFFREFGQILVEHYEMSLFHPDALHPNIEAQLNKVHAEAKWKSVNAGTARYFFAATNPRDVVCVLRLFNNIELHFVLQKLDWRAQG